MPTAEQLARLAAIGRQSVAFVQNQSQIGTISTHHRAAINRIRAQARQSIVVVDGQIEGNVPAVPGSVAASTLSSSSIRVTCADVPNENGYKWYRATVNDSAESTLVGTTGMNVAAFTDSGLTASTTYYYWVKATNTIGDSAFSSSTNSTTSALVTPGDGSADEILGTYLGHFRFDDSGLSGKYFGGNFVRYICDHPDGNKFYYIVSGPGLDINGGSGDRGYILTVTLPEIASLSPSHTESQSPLATPSATSSWVELCEDAGLRRVELGLATEFTYHNQRIGGLAYDAINQKLYVNMARHYHNNNGIFTPNVYELNPSTLQPIGEIYMPQSGGFAQTSSGPNGPLVPLAGTSLAAFGDFLVSPSYSNSQAGPRWAFLTLDQQNYETDSVSVLEHPLDQRHPGASIKFVNQRSWLTNTHFLMLVENGTDGWYGRADGRTNNGVSFVAGPGNYVPDPWGGTGVGWRAPPYRAEIWSVPISEMLEVANGVRAKDACNYTIVDITNRMMRSRTADVRIGTENGPIVSVTTKLCEAKSLIKMNGYYFVLESLATNTGITPKAVVHVWSGEN